MDENQLTLDLEVDQQASRSLIDTARWARFIAIFIFAVMALFLVLVLFLRTTISTSLENVFPGMFEVYGVLIAVVICVVLVFSAILFFLLRGANLIKKGVEMKDQQM